MDSKNSELDDVKDRLKELEKRQEALAKAFESFLCIVFNQEEKKEEESSSSELLEEPEEPKLQVEKVYVDNGSAYENM